MQTSETAVSVGTYMAGQKRMEACGFVGRKHVAKNRFAGHMQSCLLS